MDKYVLYQNVIYFNPRDYPGQYVNRQYEIRPGQIRPGPAFAFATLEEARQSIPEGMVMLSRCPDDDPTIVEVWI